MIFSRFFAIIISLFCIIPFNIAQSLVQFEQEIIQLAKQAQSSIVRLEISYPDRKIQRINSGILLDSSGHIVTVANAIKNSNSIYAFLPNQTKVSCKIVGMDCLTNIGVLQANTTLESSLSRGDSRKLQIGSFLITMGNPYGLTNSITLGVVSGLDRCAWLHGGQKPLTGLIQTTANINPGDDGGIVLNSRGEFVGMVFGTLNNDLCVSVNHRFFVDFSTLLKEINSRSLSPQVLAEKMEEFIQATSQGTANSIPYQNIILPDEINFILPSHTIYWVSEQIIRYGKIPRGWLGIRVKDDVQTLRPVILEVESNSPAQKHGLKVGDILITCNGEPIVSTLALFHQATQLLSNQTVTLTYQRDKKEYTVAIVLADEK